MIKKLKGLNTKIQIKILPQPDSETCGPTSLHAVYNYFGDKINLKRVISEVSYLERGGTLAVMLALHAIRRKYKTRIYSYNLEIFDPTWFGGTNSYIIDKLKEQLKYKRGSKFKHAAESYIEYLSLGGEILFEDLRPSLIKKYLHNGIPILTGLNATYLYNCAREYTSKKGTVLYNDIKGRSMGHFVVMTSYNDKNKMIRVADPYEDNPLAKNHYYTVRVERVINAIMLGMVSYDANLLIIQPKHE